MRDNLSVRSNLQPGSDGLKKVELTWQMNGNAATLLCAGKASGLPVHSLLHAGSYTRFDRDQSVSDNGRKLAGGGSYISLRKNDELKPHRPFCKETEEMPPLLRQVSLPTPSNLSPTLKSLAGQKRPSVSTPRPQHKSLQETRLLPIGKRKTSLQ